MEIRTEKPASVECGAPSQRRVGETCKARVLVPRSKCSQHGGGKPYWKTVWIPVDQIEAPTPEEAAAGMQEALPGQEATDSPPVAQEGPQEAPAVELTPAQMAELIAKRAGRRG